MVFPIIDPIICATLIIVTDCSITVFRSFIGQVPKSQGGPPCCPVATPMVQLMYILLLTYHLVQTTVYPCPYFVWQSAARHLIYIVLHLCNNYAIDDKA